MPLVSVIPDGLEKTAPSFIAMTCITVLVTVNAWVLMFVNATLDIW